jgi:hypothetical protein
MDDFIVFTANKDTIKEVLIVKDYPKYERIYNMIAFPYGQRFIGYGLLTGTENKIFLNSYNKKLKPFFYPDFNYTRWKV